MMSASFSSLAGSHSASPRSSSLSFYPSFSDFISESAGCYSSAVYLTISGLAPDITEREFAGIFLFCSYASDPLLVRSGSGSDELNAATPTTGRVTISSEVQAIAARDRLEASGHFGVFAKFLIAPCDDSSVIGDDSAGLDEIFYTPCGGSNPRLDDFPRVWADLGSRSSSICAISAASSASIAAQRKSSLPSLCAENSPCNTLYVGNLPATVNEDELVAVFRKCVGFKRLSFRLKPNGPMCFVEFEDIHCATVAMHDLYGVMLSCSGRSGIRLSYSKNPLGVRAPNPGTPQKLMAPLQLSTYSPFQPIDLLPALIIN